MNPVLTTLLIAVAGGLGSVLRYAVDHALPSRMRARYPWGTLLVNLSGSFALGLLAGLTDNPIIATGLLGGYTTFSTAMLDTMKLWREGRPLAATLHGPGQLLAGVATAIAGIMLSHQMFT